MLLKSNIACMDSGNSFSSWIMEKLEKARVDEVLVLQGLCESRSQAKAFVLAGQVRLGSQKLDKAAKLIPTNAPISLERPMPYVGRGGLKMENFLRESGIPPPSCHILDLGASTGGFTDCLLQSGAKGATCIDVGHGQLHYKLRTDPRVTNFEKTNIRSLKPEEEFETRRGPGKPIFFRGHGLILHILAQSTILGMEFREKQRNSRCLGQTAVRMQKARGGSNAWYNQRRKN